MPKLIMLCLVVGILSINLSAQPYQKGQLDFSLGFGFMPTFNLPGTIPGVIKSLSVNFGISPKVSIGAYTSSGSSTMSKLHESTSPPFTPQNPIYFEESHHWSFINMGMIGKYHFGKAARKNRWDHYAGLLLGYRFVKHTFETSNPTTKNAIDSPPAFTSGFLASIMVGSQFQINKYVGVFAESGYGITYLNLGVNGKLVVRR